MPKSFESPTQFEAFLAKRAAMLSRGFSSTMMEVATLAQRDAKSRLGTYQGAAGPFPKWKDLAESTMNAREAHGFTPDDPLLMSHRMANSIGKTATPFGAVMGVKGGIPTWDGRSTTGQVAMWQEFGAERLGEPWIPPRPFIGPAAWETAPEAAAIMSAAVMARITGFPKDDFVVRLFNRAPVLAALTAAFRAGKAETGGS